MKHWIEVTNAFDDNNFMLNLNNISFVYDNSTAKNMAAKTLVYCVGDDSAIHIKETYEEVKQMIKNSI